jgi:translation initiation factor IF-2
MVVLVVALDDGVRPQTEEVRESACGGENVEKA